MSDAEKVPGLLAKFVDGITKAEGGAAQMIHQHQDPRFIPIHDKLFKIKSKCISIAIKATRTKVTHVRPGN